MRFKEVFFDFLRHQLASSWVDRVHTAAGGAMDAYEVAHAII
jgi:hypothetical protein